MTLLSPTAAITDLLLGVTAFVMAFGCLRHHRQTGSRRTWWWSLGLAALGLGALLGFVTLGFETGLERAISYVHRFSVGVAVLAMLSSVVESLTGAGKARTWHLFFLCAFLAYYVGIITTGNFLIFIGYSGGALLATLLLESYRWLARREDGAQWMALGMAVSILAAVLQAAKLSFTLVWLFDHNAIYHLVQLFALFFLYRGATAAGGGQGTRTVSRSA